MLIIFFLSLPAVRGLVAIGKASKMAGASSCEKYEVEGGALPKLVVFDLDATVWLPELYTLRPPNGLQEPWRPKLGMDVKLIDGVADILRWLAASEDRPKLAIASRTQKRAWARSLLRQIEVIDGITLEKLCGGSASSALRQRGDGRVQIFPGDKQEHMSKLSAATGVAYTDMLFFDDALDGKYGNCERVSELGVLTVHTPDGLTPERWKAGLDAFASGKRGVVIAAPGPRASAQHKIFPCISMALPFASLLLNGAKTIETRNSNILAAYEGVDIAVRIGHRDWDHTEWRSALGDLNSNADELKPGFRRGNLAGIVTIGASVPVAQLAEERGWSAVECATLAPRSACGKFATYVSNPRWLKHPVKAPGKPAIYQVQVPIYALPDSMSL